MRKTIIAVMVAAVLLSGCSSEPEVVPIVQKFNPEEVLAKPPADAMIAPTDPIPLSYGAQNSVNSAIVKQNNLNAASDRGKLRVLQQYVRNLFNTQK